MNSKAVGFLDLSFSGKGGSKKKAQNVLVSFPRENDIVTLRKYMWKECTLKIKAPERELLGTRCVFPIDFHSVHL